MKISSTIQPSERLPFEEWMNFIRREVHKQVRSGSHSPHSALSSRPSSDRRDFLSFK